MLYATVQPYPSSVPPGVKDVFVWLTETPAPSDLLFVVCYTLVPFLCVENYYEVVIKVSDDDTGHFTGTATL